MIVFAEPLTQAAYAPFGAILSADRDDIAPKPANQGTAWRRDFLIDVTSERPGARLNLASFRCSPRLDWPMPLRLLEKHPASTQVFLPMNAKRYLVVVALGQNDPDLSTLRAFLAGPTQGISYFAGVWHHPMIALDDTTDFACAVWEDGSADDCTVRDLSDRGVTLSLGG